MVSWEKAEKYCVEEHEGHIASVTSQQIHEFLLKIMKQKQKYYMWIGASDQELEGKWTWSDGSKWNYTNWGTWGPDNENGANCGELNIAVNGWNDRECQDGNQYVCATNLCSGEMQNVFDIFCFVLQVPSPTLQL